MVLRHLLGAGWCMGRIEGGAAWGWVGGVLGSRSRTLPSADGATAVAELGPGWLERQGAACLPGGGGGGEGGPGQGAAAS